MAAPAPAAAEPTPADGEAQARQADDAYWAADNRVDPAGMNAFLADDVEFYPDRGGSLIGKKALAAVNLGMATSEHQFFVLPKGQPEFLAGRAFFTQLMVLQGKEWKISRIFSYEHADAK